MIWPRWEVQLLAALDVRPTRAKLDFLAAWAACEGGSAKWNPLNTTQAVPGATNYNDVGVKHYPDRLSGLAATLLTLRLPYYRDVLRMLGNDQADAITIARGSARGLVVWGTGTKCILAKLQHR